MPPPNKPPPTPAKPAHLMPLITVNSVSAIADLSGGGKCPIWKVTLKNTPVQLIIKAEEETNDSVMAFAKKNIKAMSDVMAKVSSTSSSAVLQDSELDALKHANNRPVELVKAIWDAKAKRHLLTKMVFDPNFFTTSNHSPVVGASSAMTPTERTNAILLFDSLRDNRKLWQSLGQVFIADALIGNSDRISIRNGKVRNYGNLIFAKDQNGAITHALGYDYYDAFSGRAKAMYGTYVGQDGQESYSASGDEPTWVFEFGQYIKDKTGFPKIARGTVDDLNQDRMRPLQLTEYSDRDVTYLTEGMIIGWDKLANAVGSKVRMGQGVPSGLMSRAKYLRWVR